MSDFDKLNDLIADCSDTLYATDVLPKVKKCLDDGFACKKIQSNVQSVYDFAETGGIEERLKKVLEEGD